MTIKLMTGATGEQNITAEDDRALHRGIIGYNSFCNAYEGGLKATVTAANTVTIGVGSGSFQGAFFRITEAEEVTIESSEVGKHRTDVIALAFNRNSSGKESIALVDVKGSEASSASDAKAPDVDEGDVDAAGSGDGIAYFPLYEVSVSGGNVNVGKNLIRYPASVLEMDDWWSNAGGAPYGYGVGSSATAPGLSGTLNRYFVKSNVSPGMDWNGRVEGFTIISGLLWTENQAANGGPWKLAVKAPSGSDKWCLKTTIRMTDPSSMPVGLTYLNEFFCEALAFNATTTGAKSDIIFNSLTTKKVFVASDGYVYIEMYDSEPGAFALAIYLNVTIPTFMVIKS